MRRLFSPFRLPALIAPYVLAFLALPTLSHAQEHTAGAVSCDENLIFS